jgi:small conductance mechanosensitive channel
MNQDTIEQAVDSAIPVVTTYGMQIIGAIIILILGRIVAGILAKLVSKALDRAKTDPSLRGFLVSLVKIGVMVFAVVAALAKFGIQTTSFIAVLGAAGLAIGLALQGSLANFASGVMILVFRPFRVGDLIEVAGKLGIVTDISIFVTTINSLDHKKIIIPNGSITSDVIVNVNGNGIRRVDLTAGISYSDDMEKAKQICMDILTSHPKVLQDPEPTVAVFEMADSSVNLVVRPWCQGDDYWNVWFEVTQAIKDRFDEAGVSIPFPQRDVHLFQEKAAS